MLCVSTFSFWLVIRVCISEIFICNRIITFGIKFYRIIIFIEVLYYRFVAKSIFIQKFTWSTPCGIYIHEYLFWVFLLCSKGFVHSHPIDLLRLSHHSSCQNKKE